MLWHVCELFTLDLSITAWKYGQIQQDRSKLVLMLQQGGCLVLWPLQTGTVQRIQSWSCGLTHSAEVWPSPPCVVHRVHTMLQHFVRTANRPSQCWPLTLSSVFFFPFFTFLAPLLDGGWSSISSSELEVRGIPSGSPSARKLSND